MMADLVDEGLLDESVFDVSIEDAESDGTWRRERRCVYLIRCAHAYKIGFARDVARRLEALAISCPIPMSLVYAVETNRFRQLERHLHKRFADRRIRGEWFELTSADLKVVRCALFAEELSDDDIIELSDLQAS